ncbi:hypothetical protein GCM10009828_040470 [Actinoplanes couchii]|uniref:Uncharacterized protein n=1 Tax=Actinoplanes couchii TaxID=403638 RepID=A0ABQ3XGL2_9ACTN|nr:hypothetical protein Aco03nite_060220 [Actinoplanes couchii]
MIALAVGTAAAMRFFRQPPPAEVVVVDPEPVAVEKPARQPVGLLALALALTAIAAAIALVFTRTPPVPVTARPAPAPSPSVRPFPSPSYPADPPCRMTGEPLSWEEQPSLPPEGVIPPGELGFPACWSGTPGETALLSNGGPGQLVEVTATRLPKNAFRLRFTYQGIEPFGLNVRPVVWGSFRPGGWQPATAARFPWLWLRPGRDATRTVTFGTTTRAAPVRLRVSLDPQGNLGTAEWDLL